jgi:hypothetical protein
MIDAGDVRDLLIEARWDGLVILFRAVVAAVAAQPWLAVVVFFVAMTTTRKAWVRLLRYIGRSFYRAEFSD